MIDVMQLLLEGAGALLLAVGVFFLSSVSAKLKELSNAVSDLRLEIAKEYVLKTDFVAHKERVHELSDTMGIIGNRLTGLEVMFGKGGNSKK